jgi:hypothetical protein
MVLQKEREMEHEMEIPKLSHLAQKMDRPTAMRLEAQMALH